MRTSKDVNELLQVMQICSFTQEQHVDVNILIKLLQENSLRRFANIVNLNTRAVDDNTHIKRQLENLKNSIHLQSSLHIRIIHDLKSIIDNTNLEIILLKSSAFNYSIYNSDEIRASADIDILIKRADKASFELLISEIAVKISRPKTPFENLYEETWKLKNSNTYIDIHYNIANPNLFNIDVKALFDKSEPHPHYNSKQIRVLTSSHAFIHMALHMYTDCNFLHHSLIDACNLYIRSKVDQKYCESIAKDWGCSKALGFLIYMLNYAFSMNLKNSKNNLICKHISLRSNSSSEFVRRLKQVIFQFCLTDRIGNVFNNQIKYLSSFIDRKSHK